MKEAAAGPWPHPCAPGPSPSPTPQNLASLTHNLGHVYAVGASIATSGKAAGARAGGARDLGSACAGGGQGPRHVSGQPGLHGVTEPPRHAASHAPLQQRHTLPLMLAPVGSASTRSAASGPAPSAGSSQHPPSARSGCGPWRDWKTGGMRGDRAATAMTGCAAGRRIAATAAGTWVVGLASRLRWLVYRSRRGFPHPSHL